MFTELSARPEQSRQQHSCSSFLFFVKKTASFTDTWIKKIIFKLFFFKLEYQLICESVVVMLS